MILSFLFRFSFFGSLPYQQPLSVTALSETVYEKKVRNKNILAQLKFVYL